MKRSRFWGLQSNLETTYAISAGADYWMDLLNNNWFLGTLDFALQLSRSITCSS